MYDFGFSSLPDVAVGSAFDSDCHLSCHFLSMARRSSFRESEVDEVDASRANEYVSNFRERRVLALLPP